MNYKYMVKRRAVAEQMARDHHKGQAYKLSEFGRVWLPAAQISIADTASVVRGILQVRTAMNDEEIEKCLNDLGLLRMPPETKNVSNER